MFQKEVAERIVAAPGSKAYGRLVDPGAVAQRRRASSSRSRPAPSPRRPRSTAPSSTSSALPAPRFPADPAVLSRVVALAFGQRRKMLRASLRPLGPDVEALLAAAGIPPDRARRAGVRSKPSAASAGSSPPALTPTRPAAAPRRPVRRPSARAPRPRAASPASAVGLARRRRRLDRFAASGRCGCDAPAPAAGSGAAASAAPSAPARRPATVGGPPASRSARRGRRSSGSIMVSPEATGAASAAPAGAAGRRCRNRHALLRLAVVAARLAVLRCLLALLVEARFSICWRCASPRSRL